MKTIRLEDLARKIDQRKAELGIAGQDYVAQNSGERRSESKRELLKAIEKTAREKGREPRFKANF